MCIVFSVFVSMDAFVLVYFLLLLLLFVDAVVVAVVMPKSSIDYRVHGVGRFNFGHRSDCNHGSSDQIYHS